MNTGNDKSHSSIITHRLPEFVQTDNPTLSAFVQAYYEWLESQKYDGYLRSPMALGNISDIDQELDLFVSEFKKQYLLDFPEQFAVNDDSNTVNVKQLLKNIKDFYRNKGTEKTYEFLFRILYDTAVEFYYPSRDILRLSDGKWIQKKSIRCSNEIGSRIFESRGKVVRQPSTDGSVIASGRVIDVVTYQLGSREVAELFLTNINGQFSSNTVASSNYGGIEFEGNNGLLLSEARIYPVLSSVTIDSQGTNYRKGERIFFRPSTTSDTGQGAVATITEVDTGGGINKIRIDNFGVGYETAPLYTISTSFGSGASLSTSTGTLCTYPGYYSNNDGRLSTNKVMQDNHYYQNFSYVLLSEVVIDRYKEILRRLIHPAGMGMFGKVVINRCLEDATSTDATIRKTDTELIGNYSPYTLDTYVDIGNLLFNSRPTPYFPSLHDSVITGASGNPTDLQFYSVGQNFATWSNDATKWQINTNYAFTANQGLAPNGKNQAVLVRKTTTLATILSRPITWNSSSTSATYSVYIKQPSTNAKRYVSLLFRNGSSDQNLLGVTFDFQEQKFTNGATTFSTFSNSSGTASFESVGDGWYRIKITVTSKISRGNTIQLYFGDTGAASGITFWQVGEGMLVWGMQLEEGTTAKPLIETNATPIIHRSYAIGFDPRNISGLKIWLDGKTLTAAAGATTSTWGDSSGNGYTATSYSRTLLPTISSMGGLALTGSSLTFGSVLTTPNLNLNARTIFAAFTPFPLPSSDTSTSQRNSLVVGLMGGQGTGGSTGAATGQHYQDHTICIDYSRTIVDGGDNTTPRISAYYGFGNRAGPLSLWVASPTGTDIYTGSTEVSPRRSALVTNDDTVLHSPFASSLVSLTAGNPNTTVACSTLSTDSRSLTSFAGGTSTEYVYSDKKSNDDLSTEARYYRHQLVGEQTIQDAGSYQFLMDMKTDNANLGWRAVLTKNDNLPLPSPTRSVNNVPSYIASWNFASMSDGVANAWSPLQYQTHKVSVKDLQPNDVIRIWMTPSLTSGAKPSNSSLNTSNSLYFKNFFAHKIYSDGVNQLTVDGVSKGFAVGNLDGLTANQRLTLGLGENYFNGVIHEVLVYDRILTKQERETTEAYLHHRWKNDIIRADSHAWNLPIASLTSGIYPALPTEGGYTASGNTTMALGYPFHEINSHPNIFLSEREQPYPARILRSQMNDFLGGGTGTDGYWDEWVEQSVENRHNWATGLSASGTNSGRHAMLQYTEVSPFRKITAEAFLDREVGRQFDCKNELIVEPDVPKVQLSVCPSFALNEVVYTNGTIIFNYSILNADNMEYWITDQLEVEISDGNKFYRYRPESSTWNGKFLISGFQSQGSDPKPYTVTFRLKNYYGKTIAGSEASTQFTHKYAELPSPFDTISSCG